jgi:N-acyl-D-amino-acid deacylase
MKVDFIIKNGLVFDGTGSEPFEADLGLSGDKIVFVEPGVRIRQGRVIDVKGLSVAPGFIDTHSHSEFTLLADPRAEGKICQGITTEINGNCGLSAAPLFGGALDQREDDLKELGIHERWATLREYFRIMKKRGLAINFATLVGHGNIRASVKGYEDKALTKSDVRMTCSLLVDSINEGAIGLSTGLIYPPGVYSKTEELITLAKCCKNLIYTSHMRSEGDRLIESIEETVKIGKKTGIKVHISHIKTSGEKNWHEIDNALSVMEASLKAGVALTCDRYPYTASSTELDALLPAWTYAGGKDEEMKRLKTKRIREKIKKQILKEKPLKHYWNKISISTVSSIENKWMEGRSLSEIAQIKKREPVDMLFEILIEERLRVDAIFSSMHEGNMKRFLSLPFCMIGTDSSARSFSGPTFRGKPHPRGFGSFPRFLGRYVRDSGLMSMSEALHKITMLPSKTFGIRKRGIIKRGAFADIVIFDHDKIIDRVTFDEPFLKPEGIHYVFVNGVPAMWEGELTGSQSGKILKHGR